MAHHVNIVYSSARSQVVLEEDSLKFMVDKCGTVVEPRTTPRIVGTTLKLATLSSSSIKYQLEEPWTHLDK